MGGKRGSAGHEITKPRDLGGEAGSWKEAHEAATAMDVSPVSHC